MDIQGKVALVTGAASGLGLATTRRLIAEGASVVMVDVNPSAAADVAAQFGKKAIFVKANVADEDEVQAAVDASDALGGLDIVVNCAGIVRGARVVGKNGPFPLDLFRQTVEVNLIGTFNVIRLAAAKMSLTPNNDEERGVIVSTASVAAFEGQIGQAAYSASKAGVAGITLPIARDLAQFRIRVMTIAPGLFHTPMFESLPKESIDTLAASTPHPKRLGKPAEYADLVAAIVRNPMLNGETIRLDGAVRLEPR